jgi:hypothetical protein
MENLEESFREPETTNRNGCPAVVVLLNERGDCPDGGVAFIPQVLQEELGNRLLAPSRQVRFLQVRQ